MFFFLESRDFNFTIFIVYRIIILRFRNFYLHQKMFSILNQGKGIKYRTVGHNAQEVLKQLMYILRFMYIFKCIY